MVQHSIRSPLTDSGNVTVESHIPAQSIVDRYRIGFGIDVAPLLSGIDDVTVYRCLDTGYRFFAPAHIAGDEAFYRRLQAFDWYYMAWKWEHRRAAGYLSRGMNVLEVGCGEGDFLQAVEGMDVRATGLELNGNAVSRGVSRGLDIRLESVEAHAAAHAGAYDLVCSFQVLEHIANIRSFLEAQIACLRPGGKLIISVPNNDSFLGLEENILNIPPHHMGLWNEMSLRSLTRLLPLRVVGIHLEPLQPYHRAYFRDVMVRHLRRQYRIPRRLSSRLLPGFHWALPKRLKAFTIQAVYERVVL